MACALAGCRGNELPGQSRCLAHASDRAREAFLDRLVSHGRGLDGAWRGLDIDPPLFDQICPVIDHLREHADFTGARFAAGTDFGPAHFTRRATFNGAHFGGEVRFAGVTFQEEARFNAAIFAGRAVFGASGPYYFSGAGSWFGSSEGATFLSTAELIGAEFHGDTQFEHVLFAGDIDFRQAQFRADLRLDDLRLPAQAQGPGPEPPRDIRFERARFHGGVVADLPPGRLRATGIELGGASRLTIQGPAALDRITLDHPLTVLTTCPPGALGPPPPDSTPELISLQGTTLQAPLIVGEGVSLRRCPTEGAVGLEQLGLHAGTSPLVSQRGRRVLADEILWRRGDHRRGHRLAERLAESRGRTSWEALARSLDLPPTADPIEPGPLAERYRQLRRGLEEARNAPGAADFYYGEMEMRRAASPSRFERFFLWLYWLVSGYGLRASRSIVAYLAAITVVTAVFRYGPDGLRAECLPAASCPDLDDWWSILVFVVRWSVTVFPSPELAGVSTGGQALLLALRFVSPVLLALTFLAIRARVHR